MHLPLRGAVQHRSAGQHPSAGSLRCCSRPGASA